MGTSKSYGGPAGRNPLLPPGAPPPLEDGRPEPLPGQEDEQPTWAAVKSAMTRLVTSGLQGASARPTIGSIGSRFVAAQGGARGAARASAAGRRSAAKLGAFLGQIASGGSAAAFNALHVGLQAGRPVEAILADLLEAMAPVGPGLEDSIARMAMSKTLEELLEKALLADDLASLDDMSEADAIGALERFLSHYISTQLMQRLSDRIEANSPNAARAHAIERDIKFYIADLVKIDVTALNSLPGGVLAVDWSGAEGRAFVDRIFVDAYALVAEEG